MFGISILSLTLPMLLPLLFSVVGVVIAIALLIALYDRFWQKDNIVLARFPLLGRVRYLAHEMRPFTDQYFGADNAFAPRIIIEWILKVSKGTTGYFSFDKFDTTHHLDDPQNQMVHAPTPLNNEEMEPQYPLVGPTRKHPLQFQTYFYRSAMSLGAIGFEATSAMFSATAKAGACANTGEGGFSIHHIPNVVYSPEKKFFSAVKAPFWGRLLYPLFPGVRLKNHVIDLMGGRVIPEGKRDLYFFSTEHWCFYTIDWEAPLSVFPQPDDLDESYGQVIFQVGSGLYGLRSATHDGSFEFDWERFQKIMSFCRAIEIKLAQGAKQTGGILKANKNTPVVASIRGVKPGIDLISPNRFPFYEPDEEEEFLDFCDQLSQKAGGKPVGAKIVISNAEKPTPLIDAMAKRQTGKRGLDFFTVEGGDGGSGAAPVALGILFGKRVYEAVPLVHSALEEAGIREEVKIFASAKLYAPHMSAKILALGADAVGNARSIMIAGGCIRAGLCSGEYGSCPVGLATMKKQNRRAYAQAWDEKVQQISRYITAHNKGLIQIAAICGVRSPSLLKAEHLASEYKAVVRVGKEVMTA